MREQTVEELVEELRYLVREPTTDVAHWAMKACFAMNRAAHALSRSTPEGGDQGAEATWPQVDRFLAHWSRNFRVSLELGYMEAIDEAREVFAACFGGAMPQSHTEEERT